MKKTMPLSRLWTLSLVFFTALTVVSCQKEINPLEEEENNTGGPGTETPVSESYLPHSKGSSWTYQDSALADLKTTMVATDETKTVNGITYHRYEITEGIDEGEIFYGKLKNDYYLLLQAGELVGVNAEINMLILNDKEGVGYSWTKDAGSVGGLPARIKGSIKEKGSTHTWQGTTYRNLIYTVVDLEYNMLGSWTSVGTYHFYFAKGIGLVKSNNELSLLGQTYFANASYLVDYTIK